MNTTVVCREVRPASENSKGCVIIASHEERESHGALELTAASNLTEVRDKLQAHGIVLGGALQLAQKPSPQCDSVSTVQIISHDEYGKEHRLIADYREEYSLSSGSTLYYFYIPEAQCDCRWLVGRTLEVVECVQEKARIEDIVDSPQEKGT